MSTSASSERSASSARSTASGRWASLRAGLEDFSAPFRARAGRLYRRGLKADLWDVPVMLLVTTLGLAIFGCIMVLSASSVTMISQGQSPFSQVSSQIMFLVVGVLAMAGITRIPVGVYHKKFVVYAMLIVALVMQLAVVVVGVEVNGNRNWLKLPGVGQIQPSEFSKLAIIMWLAWVYSRHGDISRSIWRTLFPSIYGVGALVLLIMLGGDMGTAMVYGFIFVGMMWLAGASRSSLLKIGGAFAALALVGVLSSANRVARIFGIWGSCTNANCDQANSGEVALTTGGFLGVGLGQSRQKYNYLAEAHNDYIFAIIGEELGLLGTLAVLLLYVGLVYCAVRIMLRTTDPLVRLATGGIMIWLTSQAIINMGMVSRILPVIGVPLPFVSYGGSSLLSSLFAAGLLLAFARQTPLRGATKPSNIETQSAREVRRENAEWQRRTPLQDVLNQEEADRAAAGGHLLKEHNPLKVVFGPESTLRRWLGFAPDQQRELSRMAREQQKEQERQAREQVRREEEQARQEAAQAREEARRAREEARLAREEAARVKAEQKAEAQKQKASQKPAPQKAPAQPRTGQQTRVAQKSTASTRAAQGKPAQPRTAQQPTAQKPAAQKRVQQPRATQPRSAQHRPSGSLPAGLQPLHPEDRQRRAQRLGNPRQGAQRQAAPRQGTQAKGTPKNSAQQAPRPAQGAARNSAQRGTRKQG
ncbi:FtsW/RodA/SpoVE family cell cycle protein [Rothia sp. (in: high G+C Gram-positive bacteria)]|uniref:FtsW/RodA/SpoVE family cell cycle protein n=1 Tax=Rothia sp. (in: high G+C Gram-positive bacteria) TaxID=1885016 RepID=UPI001CAF9E73|nr:FtsW/RodA/SpoVE family cell cycle protein [Rothia sp. (in: high G+C Gram-positive bacteria)]MBF1654592.1 FtsW/RodA/SpoVE family cell cycle protein [Rothia sp. (in: high G+C Gram-positive bacteria)]